LNLSENVVSHSDLIKVHLPIQTVHLKQCLQLTVIEIADLTEILTGKQASGNK